MRSAVNTPSDTQWKAKSSEPSGATVHCGYFLLALNGVYRGTRGSWPRRSPSLLVSKQAIILIQQVHRAWEPQADMSSSCWGHGRKCWFSVGQVQMWVRTSQAELNIKGQVMKWEEGKVGQMSRASGQKVKITRYLVC